MSEPSLAAGMVGAIHYRLTTPEGETLDSSAGREPLVYLHGSHNIVPGLESALAGAVAGEERRAEVAPADGYGERTGDGPQSVHRRDFPKDADLREGMAFRAQGSDGHEVTLWISKLEGSRVWVDTNHPLAGQTLIFDVTVVAVRAATADEAAHGHAHGIHGNATHH